MSPSQALTKRDSETSLMPPPPPKRIKRPATVLDEDVYTDALSHIIVRDYFPGLLESQVKQEYLDALDSKDKEWITSSRKKLTDLMATPGRSRPRFDAVNITPSLNRGAVGSAPGDTPAGWGGDTPMSVVSATTSATETTAREREPGPDVSKMGLLDFQAKYTSEDNESFNKLLDKQNTKRREKHAWLWSGNKIPTVRQIAHRQRETKRIEAQGGVVPDDQKQVAIKTDLDVRPAKPDGWKPQAENSLMFLPSSIEDSYETIQQKAEAASRAGPKRVVYQNTRLPEDNSSEASSNPPPPSPSISAIQDAIAGRPRQTETEAGYTGGETPRVNGYAFVDEDEPEPEPASTTSQQASEANLDDYRLLGPADNTPNPFSIKQNRRREDLHHRMVDRVARTKRAEKAAATTKTPVSATPRFASSPRLEFGLRTPGSATPGGGGGGAGNKALTPAAQKLLSGIGRSPRAGGERSSSGLRNMWTPTPRRRV
ncbi:splicing factor ESS-2 family protein [Aspergillus undulatus]|uniref:splicing factor ESS-2 family protein n=1 Tax=Aspergillus undulatus TaxID=1810928 RepID=UPI003CCD72C1